jgi:hypothetical protein
MTMRWPSLGSLPVGAWKLLLCVVALFVATLLATELWYAPRTLAPDSRGTLGIQYHELEQWGRSRFVIDEIAPDSPLRAAGAKVGDVWIPDRHYDAYRWLESHEPIGLTLIQGEQSRHVTVETLPDPTQVPAGLLMESWFIGVVALFLGLLIGLRQPHGLAFRSIALAMCLSVVARGNPTYVTIPAGSAFALQHLAWGPLLLAAGLAVLTFVFNFPDDRPRDTVVKRRLFRYSALLFAPGCLTMLLVPTMRALGFHAPMSSQAAFAAFAVPFCLVSLLILWSNWRGSTGDLRERHFWIGLAFGLYAPTPAIVTLLQLQIAGEPFLAGEHFMRAVVYVPRTLFLLSLLLFAYAVLRHRVASVSFAVNRAAIYGAASLGMLLSFALLEWFTHGLLAAWGHEQSPYVDAGIALAIILVFHRLRHSGEQLVERFFFHGWHAKEAALRKFIAEAPHITRIEALRGAFAAALDRFTGGAGHAFYRRLPSGDYKRVISTLPDAPAGVDADDPLAVTLRAKQGVTHVRDTATALPAEIALPSIHHGELDGFVLLGPKARLEAYRPDELAVLGLAAHQVGLDLRALRMEQLERANSELRTRIIELNERSSELQARNEELRAWERGFMHALQRSN